MYARFTLIVVLVPLLTAPAHAGIIFGRKAKPDPAVRVPELIQTVRTDGDENKRVNAIEELRQYDPASFPEIMPALIDALLNDRKAAVRAEAASTIAKLRPVSQAAGDALEQALDKDSSVRVRLQVRSALLQYHWAGYRQGKKEDPPPQVTTKEPPLADPKPVNPPAQPTPTPPRPLPPIQPVPTPPPPIQPAPTPPPPSVSPVPSPLPQGPPVEAPPPSPTKPPQADSGPDLGGPPE
jgi:uncharacterized membrane protein